MEARLDLELGRKKGGGVLVRVLVVDDAVDAGLGDLIERALAIWGEYDVLTASNGAQGLVRFRTSGPFDLVIVNINMPILRGDEMIRAIREGSDVPIITMDAKEAGIETARNLLEDGVISACLGKPFSLENLRRTVAVALQSKAGGNMPDRRGGDSISG